MNGDKGFTYPAALAMIVIVSVALMTVQKQWRTTMIREKETELFFRAGAMVEAIKSYYHSSPGDNRQYPKSLDVLLKDNRFMAIQRHLRKIYKDPMSPSGEWGMVYDGRGGIKGVFSKSDKMPIKQGNFPKQYQSFEKKKKYSDWKFVYDPKKETTS